MIEKDDLVAQYQESIKEILKAKDELEKKLQAEKEKLLLELKKIIANVEGWKKQCDIAILRSNDEKSLHDFEKENGIRIAKEMALLIQQHAKE